MTRPTPTPNGQGFKGALAPLLRTHYKCQDVNAHMRRIIEWTRVYTPSQPMEEYIQWTEDDWRARCTNVGNKWSNWVKERMPKKIQPKSNTLLKCVKCGEYAVDMYLKQTRSRDEPMTQFCFCSACKHRWRQ